MRIILLIAILGISKLTIAQRQNNSSILKNKALSANSDTLLYINLPNLSVNSFDSASFQFRIEDGDGLSSIVPGAPSQYYPTDFLTYYSVDSSKNTSGGPTKNNFYHPWELQPNHLNDTAFYLLASSVSDTLGTANDWLWFGQLVSLLMEARFLGMIKLLKIEMAIMW
ncbi:MAG: hypothetical protein IPH89_10880 [Bacteroidetes bacterium]|nr:hypothetical protein [Bacteroidota bacterium]